MVLSNSLIEELRLEQIRLQTELDSVDNAIRAVELVIEMLKNDQPPTVKSILPDLSVEPLKSPLKTSFSDVAKCPDCDRSFNVRGMGIHHRRMHKKIVGKTRPGPETEGEGMFECLQPKCNCTYETEVGLGQHLRMAHGIHIAVPKKTKKERDKTTLPDPVAIPTTRCPHCGDVTIKNPCQYCNTIIAGWAIGMIKRSKRVQETQSAEEK